MPFQVKFLRFKQIRSRVRLSRLHRLEPTLCDVGFIGVSHGSPLRIGGSQCRRMPMISTEKRELIPCLHSHMGREVLPAAAAHATHCISAQCLQGVALLLALHCFSFLRRAWPYGCANCTLEFGLACLCLSRVLGSRERAGRARLGSSWCSV